VRSNIGAILIAALRIFVLPTVLVVGSASASPVSLSASSDPPLTYSLKRHMHRSRIGIVGNSETLSSALSANVTLRDPDGGVADPYQGDLPPIATFLPTGVWLEGVYTAEDVAKDKATGINVYVGLTRPSNLALLAAGGMRTFGQHHEWTDRNRDSTGALTGYVLSDEIDMQHSPREARAQLESIIHKLPVDGRHRYNNYGKGVMFWWGERDARQIVNTYQHTVSADAYWFTDPFICGPSEGGALLGKNEQLSADECRRAANYGRTVTRMRKLAGPDQPVWNFVEVGGPWGESRDSCSGVADTCSEYIKPREISAAVVHSYLAGARGVVYFNHTFGGVAQSQHALREPYYAPQRAEVARINSVMAQVAPWINGWFVDFNGSSPGELDIAGNVLASARWDGARFLIIAGHAGSRTDGEVTATLSVPCVGDAVATVIEEHRTVLVVKGVISDSFADGLTTHIYRIDGGATCGLQNDR
jgi:hypothetical protein